MAVLRTRTCFPYEPVEFKLSYKQANKLMTPSNSEEAHTLSVDSPEIAAAREHLARIGALLFERRLTDAGGGNISVQVGDLICLSPRYSGNQHQWQLHPEQVLVIDRQRNILAGNGSLSRESQVHVRLYEE
jgi:hypothetical protein